jgi:hypothetical protein
MRKSVFTTLFLLWAAVGSAQTPLGNGTITAQSTGACNSGACVVFTALGTFPSLTIQISGTFSATVAFESTSDGINWVSTQFTNIASGGTATTSTSAGQFAIGNTGLQAIRVRATTFSSGVVNIYLVGGNSHGSLGASGSPGSGTVTSVDVAVPAYLTSTGGPVTTSGTITLASANATANQVLAGPTTGSPAPSAFRALVANDIPSLSSVYVPVTRTVNTLALSSNITVTYALLGTKPTTYTGAGSFNISDTTSHWVSSISDATLDNVHCPSGAGTWVSCGGATGVAGSNKMVQFNDSGVFGGVTGFQFDKATNQATLTGMMQSAGHAFAYTSVSGDSTLGINNDIVDCDATAANRTINLPAAANAKSQFIVRKTDSSAHTCTIVPAAGLIDGQATQVIQAQYAGLQVTSDGSAFHVTGLAAAPFVDPGSDSLVYWDHTTTHNFVAATLSSELTLTAGQLAIGTVPVTKGGTGIASGTSGGVPCFTGSTTISSSGALTANLPVIGGGAGACPSVGARSGNTTTFASTTGSFTNGNCVKTDANHNFIDAATTCGGGSGGTDVSFWVSKSGNQSITASTETTVTWDVINFDTTSAFASNAFTPQTAGKYQINASIYYSDAANIASAAGACVVELIKNGTEIFENDEVQPPGWNNAGSGQVYGTCNAHGSWLVSMNGSTDTLTIKAYDSRRTGTSTVNNNNTLTVFSGALIR